MADDEVPSSDDVESIPSSDVPTPRSSAPSASDFRARTMQSKIDDTQERPPFVPPFVPPLEPDPFPPSHMRDADPLPSTEDLPQVSSAVPSAATGPKLDTFVAVMAANADRIAAGQNRFLKELGDTLAGADEEEGDSVAEQTRLLRTISRDLQILIAVALSILALGLWLGGRQSAAAPPIVVTPAAP